MKKLYLSLFLLLFLATAAFAKVNINTADAEQLATLTGIGSVKAEAIVKYRKDNGKFKNINELKEVKGIGDKIIEKIHCCYPALGSWYVLYIRCSEKVVKNPAICLEKWKKVKVCKKVYYNFESLNMDCLRQST